MLHTASHGTGTLVHNDYLDFQRVTSVPTINSGANETPASVQSLMLTVVEP